MASNDREERRRLRQRGAGTSGVTGLNFGFTFGAPAIPPQSPSRHTPRALPRQPSSRRTPSTNPLPAQRSSRRIPNADLLPANGSTQPTPAALAPRASSRKIRSARSTSTETASQRRSSSAHQTSTEQRLSKTPQQSGQTVVTPSLPGKGRPGAALEAPSEIQKDELEQNNEEHQTSAAKGRVEAERRTSVPALATPKASVEGAEDELEENDGEHTLSSERRRTRTSLGLSLNATAGSSKQAPRQKDDATASPIQVAKKLPVRPRKSLEDAEAEPSTEGRVQNNQDTPGSAPRKKRGRPKKSLPGEQGQVAKRAAAEPAKEKRTGKRQSVKQPAALISEEREEAVDEAQDELSPGPIKTARKATKQKRKAKPAAVEEEAEESAEDDLQSRASTPEASTSNVTRLSNRSGRPSSEKAGTAKPKPRKTQASEDGPARKRQKRSEDKTPRVPVTVYRLSKSHMSTEEPDDLELPARPTRLPAVNPVDILAQITIEMIARMSTSLTNQAAAESDKPKRAELKRRVKTIDAFSVELADRLFDLTEAVDTGEALKARVKTVLKEKSSLRDEFLAIRKQRDELALQMDAVRKKHTDAENERRSDEELNGALFDIELAVQRGRERALEEDRQDEGPEIDVEWILRDVAGAASSAGRCGGLLKGMKSFNGYLERAAAVLEGRS